MKKIETEEKCNCRKIAVKLAKAGIVRGIISCENCDGYSLYDVIKQPEKYKDLL